MLKNLYQLFSLNKALVLIVFFGSLTWSLTMLRSGVSGQFWGANGHDGLWHVALANSLAKGSLEVPVFAGESLRNYHIGFDLLVAILHRITSIPIITLYFQVLPIVLAILIGSVSYLFVIRWRNSQIEAIWATFFTYFAGSWGWLFGKQDSMFWSQQSITTLINPPFALSLVFLMIGL